MSSTHTTSHCDAVQVITNELLQNNDILNITCHTSGRNGNNRDAINSNNNTSNNNHGKNSNICSSSGNNNNNNNNSTVLVGIASLSGVDDMLIQSLPNVVSQTQIQTHRDHLNSVDSPLIPSTMLRHSSTTVHDRDLTPFSETLASGDLPTLSHSGSDAQMSSQHSLLQKQPLSNNETSHFPTGLIPVAAPANGKAGTTKDQVATNSESQEGNSPKRRNKTSKEQFAILCDAFCREPMPDAKLRKALSLQTGMTPRSIQVWFQNRRAKLKGLTAAERDNALKGEQHSLYNPYEFPLKSHGHLQKSSSLDTSFMSQNRSLRHQTLAYMSSFPPPNHLASLAKSCPIPKQGERGHLMTPSLSGATDDAYYSRMLSSYASSAPLFNNPLSLSAGNFHSSPSHQQHGSTGNGSDFQWVNDIRILELGDTEALRFHDFENTFLPVLSKANGSMTEEETSMSGDSKTKVDQVTGVKSHHHDSLDGATGVRQCHESREREPPLKRDPSFPFPVVVPAGSSPAKVASTAATKSSESMSASSSQSQPQSQSQSHAHSHSHSQSPSQASHKMSSAPALFSSHSYSALTPSLLSVAGLRHDLERLFDFPFDAMDASSQEKCLWHMLQLRQCQLSHLTNSSSSA